MKTSEFIKEFNKLVAPIYIAERKENEKDGRSVVINCADYSGRTMTKARLIEGGKVWDIGGLFGAEMLELMAELAKTPPEERENVKKYVILNGDPRHGTCYYFTIDDRDGRLIPNLVTDVSKLEAHASFSKEVLAKRKLALGPELAAAVDKLTVSLECAIELMEKSKHDDLD